MSTVTPEMQAKKTRKSMLFIVAVFGAALAVLALGVGGGIIAQKYFFSSTTSSVSTPLTAAVDGNRTITDEESSIAAVAEKVGPSVVSVITQVQARGYYGTTSAEAAGTGIVVSADGYIMTNNHVVENAETVSIVDSTGALYEDVEVIGRDPLNDVAFLKVSSDTEFTPAVLGNSSTIRTGQQVIAIGNALGQYSNTVTSGIISGTGRPITASTGSGATETLTDLIQTDASINQGNSGGPLVNLAGQVIGINTAIIEDANGIGFSIPINSTKGVLAGVLENGTVDRAYIGVNYLTVTPDVAREYNLPVNQGAYIYAANGNAVLSNGPAAKAGLQDGDVITNINDQEIGTDGGLSSILGQYQPGDQVSVSYIRDGQTRTTTVTLASYSR